MFLGTQKQVRISHGKRAIGVRVIEVLLYFFLISPSFGASERLASRLWHFLNNPLAPKPFLQQFNPNKLGVPFVGHRQTAQTQIRRRIMRRLIRVFTVGLQDFQLQIEQKRKNASDTP